MTRVAAAPMPWTKRRASSVVETRREGRGERRRDIDGQPAQQRRPPAEAVGQRAEDELREAEAGNIGGDDILPVVLVLDAEAGADLLQAGQHDVDGERVERHQRRGERDELPARDRQACSRLPGGEACWSMTIFQCAEKEMRRKPAHSRSDEPGEIRAQLASLGRQAAPLTLTPFSSR